MTIFNNNKYYLVSDRMVKLARPHTHKDTVSRKNPFAVKKSALTSPVPARMTDLAKPSHPRDPVEKRPPRKLNKYRQPIFPMPVINNNTHNNSDNLSIL